MNNFSDAAAPPLALSGLTGQEAAIVTAIEAAITEQRLAPATRLTEEELAELYGVSRMRVRRVLLALAHSGMVVLRPGRGAQVASPSAAEARAVFAARRLIEVRLLESPEQPPRREALRGLRRLVANENEASRQGDRSGMIQLSGAFHVELAQACGNAVLAEIIAGLVRRSSLIIALYQTGHVACCRATEHAALLRLLGAGRYREAAAAMEAHLAHIEAGLDPAMQPAPRADLGRALGSRAA